jgi:hypothetical protein
MFAQLNGCFRITFPGDSLCENVPVGSITTRSCFKIPVLKQSEKTFPLKEEPFFIECISLDDDISHVPSMNWLPLGMIYASKFLVLPIYKDNFDLSKTKILHLLPLVVDRDLLKGKTQLFSNFLLFYSKSITAQQYFFTIY